jgi:hypothetical protein
MAAETSSGRTAGIPEIGRSNGCFLECSMAAIGQWQTICDQGKRFF